MSFSVGKFVYLQKNYEKYFINSASQLQFF